MKNTRSKIGRPEKAEGKRTKKIDARFTEDEFKIVLELEKTLGVSKTDLVRNRLLHDAHPIIMNAKELISSVDDIGAELGRCGNNINQLAKYANVLHKAGRLSPVVVERFNLLFQDYNSYQVSLEVALRRIIRILGRR
ncbi:MAG: plasmid mobilization relaxosome protein MobC [Bacteroidetes bacterium]|nr:plasmid mobilization relaxosome protein MobC [Bacteroidota bacterium]